jgi:hypothetical protein
LAVLAVLAVKKFKNFDKTAQAEQTFFEALQRKRNKENIV